MEYCPKCQEFVEPMIEKQAWLGETDEIRFFHDIYYDVCPDCNTILDTKRHDTLNLKIYTEKYEFYSKLLHNGG
jgi:uncharacterized protein with PIN domain